MKTIYLRGGNEKNTAIKVLTAHLTRMGHTVSRRSVGAEAIVCWGTSIVTGLPALNARVNSYDKFGVPHPQVFSYADFPKFMLNPPPFPWLARNVRHMKGKDIIKVESLAEAMEAVQRRKEFFSVYIPTATEYRVWTFGDTAFAVYEKVYKGEGEYKGIQRNHNFGFKFVKQDDLRSNKHLCIPCVKAVRSLNMDFGAVDVLLGKDGKYYVLEVNSMPQLSNVTKSHGIRLAQHISNWAERA